MAVGPEASALYLDTSALIKLYVEAAVEGAQVIATSVVAYAEARTALARRHREKDFTASEYRGLVSELDASWEGYERLGLTEGLAREAGELAEEHTLRDFDAVHLASALRLMRRFPRSAFLVFDERLSAAAEHASLSVLRP